jgi:potassium channel subfamily K
MARRIRFAIAQPIIIAGWYISSGLLIGILIPFGVLMYKPENDGRIYTQSYFYGAFAAGLYFIIASLMAVTAWGASKGHYSREYKLTTSQRTLMLQTIVFFIYLLGGSAVYAKIEGWRYLDAVYWADYTLLTIGVGNFAPATHLGRGLLFPYAVGGIVILGLIISSIRTLMLEHGRQKISAVLTDRTRRLLVKEAYSDKNRLPGLVPSLGENNPATSQNERERQKREFITMRRVRQLATMQHKWISLAIALTTWMALWFIGAVVFWRSESNFQWSYFQALYFAYTTLLTIGYGDIYPVSNLGKAFFVFWSLLAIPSITILISSIGDTLIRFLRDITIFLGELTILPSDEPFHERVKAIFKISWKDKWLQETTGEKEDGQDVPKEPGQDAESANFTNRKAPELAEHKKEEHAHERGDIAAENIHHYHYLLFREVRKMTDYAMSDMTRQFDYLEWEYYLALISGKHKPPAPESTDDADSDDEMQRVLRDWSWIDHKNPLLGEKSEVQWLLAALTDALDHELSKASRSSHPHDANDEGVNGLQVDEDRTYEFATPSD